MVNHVPSANVVAFIVYVAITSNVVLIRVGFGRRACTEKLREVTFALFFIFL